jgi:ParB-like chromosome segregation protein Spo0J
MIAPDTPLTAIRPADWRSNYVLKPDLRLLASSLRDYGWVAPLLVRSADSTIIDGFHRWVIAQNDQEVHRRDGGKVPVVWVDVDQVDAMVMHVRLNRARGQLMARSLSGIVRTILQSRKYRESQLYTMLEMKPDELELLMDGSLLKSRKVSEHQYSAAWIPIEAPRLTNKVAPAPEIERPPNQDR